MGVFDLDPLFAHEWQNNTSGRRACPILGPGRDVMSTWPDDWDSADNQRWANALSWGHLSGSRGNVRTDTGFDAHVLNYAFNKLYPTIPSRADGQVLHFDVRTSNARLQESDVDAKMRNFYKALQYIKQYPTMQSMFDTMQVSDYTFYGQIMPTIYSTAEDVNFMDPQLRFWEWNHCEHFQERVTCMCDGYPVRVGCPKNRFVQRLLKSGK